MGIHASSNKGGFSISGDLDFVQFVQVDGKSMPDCVETGCESMAPSIDGQEGEIHSIGEFDLDWPSVSVIRQALS